MMSILAYYYAVLLYFAWEVKCVVSALDNKPKYYSYNSFQNVVRTAAKQGSLDAVKGEAATTSVSKGKEVS